MCGDRVISWQKNISIFLILFSLLSSVSVNAQVSYNWRDRIDRLIEEIDSLSLQSQSTFYSTGYLKNSFDPIRETWHYTIKDNRVAIFQVRYYVEGNEITESYYLDRGRLVCMEQYETVILDDNDDAIKQGEVFYFLSNSLIQYVSLGKSPERITNFDRQTLSLKKFEERYSELQRNLAKK